MLIEMDKEQEHMHPFKFHQEIYVVSFFGVKL